MHGASVTIATSASGSGMFVCVTFDGTCEPGGGVVAAAASPSVESLDQPARATAH